MIIIVIIRNKNNDKNNNAYKKYSYSFNYYKCSFNNTSSFISQLYFLLHSNEIKSRANVSLFVSLCYHRISTVLSTLTLGEASEIV